MDEEMQMNPDFQLVMKFLQNIRPGDMDEESSQQLMAIGQRIQNGGALSDKEREMLESVVGAMPEMEMSYEVDGQMEGMTPSQMDAARSSGEITPMTDAERQIAEEAEYFKRLREQQEQMYNVNQIPQKGFLVSPNEGGIPAVQIPSVTGAALSDAEKMRIRMMRGN
tara:strand:- start:1070 stop:1570 length:501 start_codon:yes stop_codon:yes gene_type:complete